MKAYFLILFFTFAWNISFCQHSITGQFDTKDSLTYVIAYAVEPSGLQYITHSEVQEKRFALTIPDSTKAGILHLVYAIPQEKYYIETLYSGEEDIDLRFTAERHTVFMNSEENGIYEGYLDRMGKLDQQVMEAYGQPDKGKSELPKIHEERLKVQEEYERLSQNLLVGHIVKSNRPYLPKEIESLEAYLGNERNHFLGALDLDNPIVLTSDYLKKRLNAYLFTQLPKPDAEIRQEGKERFQALDVCLEDLNEGQRLYIYKQLWEEAITQNQFGVSDVLFNGYIKPLAEASGDQKTIDRITAYSSLRIGATSPEVSWTDNNGTHRLSEMTGANRYLLIFWSSNCSHCLNELPPLHELLKTMPGIEVIAVGLEDGKSNWERVSARFDGFHHVIALGKWESDYAHTFNVQGTPTYFILDDEKRIIAKPTDGKEVIAFLKK